MSQKELNNETQNQENSVNHSQENAADEPPKNTENEIEEICCFEIIQKIICSLIKKHSIISIIVIGTISLCISHKEDMSKVSNTLPSISGFSLASLTILFSFPKIKKLKKEQRNNLFAEFIVGIILPIVCLLFIEDTSIIHFLYTFSLLWCINLGFHLFSISSLFDMTNKNN